MVKPTLCPGCLKVPFGSVHDCDHSNVPPVPSCAAPPRDAEAIMQAVNDLIEEEIELMLIIGLPRSKQEGITAKRDAARARLEALVRGK